MSPILQLDRLPKYDLTKWNPEFFDRPHRFVSLAPDYGIVIEVVLLSNTYQKEIWELNPLHAANNINGLPEIEWTDYNTLLHPEVFEWQAAHCQKIVEELNGYANIFLEVCNEPGGHEEMALVDPGSRKSSISFGRRKRSYRTSTSSPDGKRARLSLIRRIRGSRSARSSSKL